MKTLYSALIAWADMCTEMFSLVSMGDEQRVKRAQTLERGPPLAQAELYHIDVKFI